MHRLQIISTIVCFLLNASITLAYQPAGLDSLEALLEDADGVAKVDLLNQISFQYWNINPAKTDSLGQLALQLAQQLEYAEGEASAYHKLAVANWMQSDHDQAFEDITLSLNLFETLNDSAGMNRCHMMMALIMEEQGNYPQAIQYHQKSIAFEQANNDALGMALAMNNLAAVYYRLRQLDTALQYYQASLAIREQAKYENGMRESYSNLSVVYRELGQYEQALAYSKQTRSLAQKLARPVDILNAEINYADILNDMGKLDSAQRIYLNLLPQSKELAVPKRTIEILTGLRKVAEKQGNFRSALAYSDDLHTLRDSVLNLETAERIAKLQAQYQSEKREKAIVALQQESQNRTLWRNIFAIGILASLIFIILLYLSFRYRAQKNAALLRAQSLEREQLEELNQMRSRFFANISHEFRTPLTLISGPVKQLLGKTEQAEDKQLLGLIQKNANRLLKLINQLLELSRFEAGQVQLKASHGDLLPLLKGWTMAFGSLAEEKNISLQFHSEGKNYHTYFEADKIEQAFTNLLSNAFKFTPEGGKIEVVIKQTSEVGKDYVSIAVQDTGIGIPKAAQQHIFDRFYQAHQYEEGSATGIGLSLAREFIELHKGSLQVESTPDKGSTFTLLLPLGREHLADDQISPISSSYTVHEQVPSITEYSLETQENRETAAAKEHTILVVEDNADLRLYLRELISPQYIFIEAHDGKEGLALAFAHSPDMVLSDVMMPNMNGIELCHRLKSDMKTSHIPIILLTAKSEEEDRLLGLENLADAYMVKPFNTRELLATIENLFGNRKKLQDHYQIQALLQPQKIVVDSVEGRFLEELANKMEENLQDELFGVEQLAENMAMSRSQLHRKLKAIANMSPSQYIRSFRLERAKELLEGKGGTVTEIAFAVGFNNPSYFAKCFQEQYGMLPGKLLKDQ